MGVMYFGLDNCFESLSLLIEYILKLVVSHYHLYSCFFVVSNIVKMCAREKLLLRLNGTINPIQTCSAFPFCFTVKGKRVSKTVSH